jgi:hypothetical protein
MTPKVQDLKSSDNREWVHWRKTYFLLFSLLLISPVLLLIFFKVKINWAHYTQYSAVQYTACSLSHFRGQFHKVPALQILAKMKLINSDYIFFIRKAEALKEYKTDFWCFASILGWVISILCANAELTRAENKSFLLVYRMGTTILIGIECWECF